MNILDLSEIVWNFYSNGRPDAKDREFEATDVREFLKLAISNTLRKTYYDSRRNDDYGEFDYGLVSSLLVSKRISLPECDESGKRAISIANLETYRFPKNAQFNNIYPVNKNCGGQKLKASTEVRPGEEYFYSAAKFHKFLHHVIRSTEIEVYNWPPCVSEADVLCTSYTEESNLPMDVAFDAAVFVLNITLDIKGKYDPIVLKKQLEREQALKN